MVQATLLVGMSLLDAQLQTGKTVRQELMSAAELLVALIQDGIDDYYASYSPVVYDRTGRVGSGILFSDIGSVSINGNTASVTIEFNNNAIHRNLPSFKSRHDVNALLLIDEGWNVKRGWHSGIYRFGFFEGAHFIDEAMRIFNMKNSLGIRVEKIL